MRNINLLAIVVLFIFSCSSNNVEPENNVFDDSSLGDSLRTIYKVDASRLALKDIFENDLPQKDDVIIDSSIVAEYYFALVSIYNSSSNERNIILDTLNIHTFFNPAVFKFGVAVNKNTEWSQNWINEEIVTGVDQIDTLLAPHNLSISRYYSWPFTDFFEIESQNPINNRPLCDKLFLVPEISSATPNYYIGDGSTIVGTRVNNKIGISYYYKWGDCPSGCIAKHWWTFSVNIDGFVEFMGEFGDELP